MAPIIDLKLSELLILADALGGVGGLLLNNINMGIVNTVTSPASNMNILLIFYYVSWSDVYFKKSLINYVGMMNPMAIPSDDASILNVVARNLFSALNQLTDNFVREFITNALPHAANT